MLFASSGLPVLWATKAKEKSPNRMRAHGLLKLVDEFVRERRGTGARAED